MGFIYGEHAVLSGHKALLFKPDEYVCVALAVERSVPDIRIRLRAYSKNEALNWFLDEKCEEFIPIIEHEEADLFKFKIIEDIIFQHIKKNENKRKNINDIMGIAKIFHISYFRPGSGINWSGSSALAISKAIHEFYFKNFNEDDIRKLAFSIELTYQEGKASGYGFANFEKSKFIGYQLTSDELKKIRRLKSEKIDEKIKRALSGDYIAQKEYIDFITEGDNVIFVKEHDFQLESSPTSIRDKSITELFQDSLSSPFGKRA